MRSSNLIAAAALLSAGVAATGVAALPDRGMTVDGRTALVVTDPQNDFLSPDGVTWGVVGESVPSRRASPLATPVPLPVERKRLSSGSMCDERRRIRGVWCLPVEEFLSRLHPAQGVFPADGDSREHPS